MNIIQINATAGIGSTGKIMIDLDGIINSDNNGFMICAYQNNNLSNNLFSFNNKNSNYVLKKNILISRITGIMGHRHTKETYEAIKWLDEKQPDIVHLHNIHGDWIDYRVLFKYLKEKNIPVIWTLHDCWAFTGRCSHFELCGCEKWKSGCFKCTNKHVYPITYFFDHSSRLWNEKKNIFTGLEKMTIVTPSMWLKEYVENSFLSKYPVVVINNGIDTDIYKPVTSKSKYYDGIQDKKIILAVASSWSTFKGLDDIMILNNLINHDLYQIVIVGLNDKQMEMCPDNIVGVSRTNSQEELVELYSGADVFINLTYQDNYPTTNLEAISCGTNVITYNTGGSPESIPNKEYIVNQGDVQKVYELIVQICQSPKEKQKLREYAINHFDKNIKFNDYIKLYKKILET